MSGSGKKQKHPLRTMERSASSKLSDTFSQQQVQAMQSKTPYQRMGTVKIPRNREMSQNDPDYPYSGQQKFEPIDQMIGKAVQIAK